MENTHPENNTVPEHTPAPIPMPLPSPAARKPERHPVSPTLYQLRKYFVYILVGGLIISALIAIIAVLIGNMSGLVGKTIGTVVVIIIHSLIALGFISITSAKQPNRGSAVVINTLFAITVLSLITAMLSIWEVTRDGVFVARTYTMFFAAFITSLVVYGLFQSTDNDKSTGISRNTAIGSSLVLFSLLLPIIYKIGTLPEFYYRVLTAVCIVVGVSVVITVIFHWYYMSKHPELRSGGQPLTVGKIIGRSILVLLAIWILMAVAAAIYQGLVSPYSEYDYEKPAPRPPTPDSRYY